MLQPSMLKIFRLSPLVVALAVLGCSGQGKPFDSVDYLREQYAKEIGAQASRVEVPFELNDEIRKELVKLPRLSSELRRVNQVNDFIFDGLQLQYLLTPTR